MSIPRATRLVVVLALLAWASPASAVPAAPREQVLTNADGSTIVAVIKGDEWRNWVETSEGFTIGLGANGNWYYVQKYVGRNPVLDATPARNAAPVHLEKHVQPTTTKPTQGGPQARAGGPQAAPPFGSFTGPVLFLLAEFSNRAGTTSEASWGTFVATGIVDYFNETSHGAVTLTPATETFGTANNGVVGWLNLGYPHPNTADTFGDANQTMTRDAIVAADPYINYAAYDVDFDGYVDPDELSVVLIAAGFERSYSMDAPSVWGHRWAIFCCGGAPLVDGVIVGGTHDSGGYAQFGEIHSDHQATLGIMVHELGHLIFGLPDLYDYDGSSAGVGAFSLMAGGSWGAKFSDPYLGTTPVAPDAWTKYDRGWVDGAEGSGVETIVGGGSPLASASNTVFRTSTVIPTEYFLVENRQNLGYDQGLQQLIGGIGGGIAIWHVDETRFSNDDDAHRKVDLEQADGTDTYGDSADLWYVGHATSFNDASVPNSRRYDGVSTGKSVETLTASAVSMDVEFSSPVCGDGVAEGGEACDGGDLGTCPIGPCDLDCTCPAPVCGNNVVESGEQCDGTSDAACPGSCGTGGAGPCQCPSADECTSPRVIAALPYTDTQDTTTATIAPNDPFLSCGTGGQQAHSVWYTLVAPANGVVTANTFGSNYDTVLAALVGTCGAFSIQACNDDNGGLQSFISFPVTSGATYYLEITSYGGGSGGNLSLNVSFSPSPTPTPTPTAALLCGSTPAVCRTPSVGGKAYVALTDKADEKDQLQWKWAAGAATSKGEFGNPVTTNEYALCLYDATGLLATLTAPAGGTCGTKACWADKPKGYQYKDKEATPTGITQLQLSEGADGKAKIQVKGKGVNLPDLDLSMLASPVTVQLQRSGGGVCFGATYSAPALKDDGIQFKDKAD